MHFTVVIGNPPYQETKGGTKNVDIWPYFIRESNKISDKSLYVHPGRWVFAKKNAKKLQQELVEEQHLKQFIYFIKTEDVFSGIVLNGGVSITVFDKNYTGIPTFYVNSEYKGEFILDKLIFTDKFLEEAYNKVWNKIQSINQSSMLKYIKGSIGSIGNCSFGVDKKRNGDKIYTTNDNMKNPVKAWINMDTRNSRGEFSWKYIDFDDLLDYPDYLFTSRKVMITSHGNAIHDGKGNVINNNPQIVDKLGTAVDVLWFYPANDTDRELELIKSLFMTKTTRFLMSVLQRDRYCMGFECIPDYLELAKLLPEDELFTDNWFYKTFNFSPELIANIEDRVSPKKEK